MTRSLHVHAVIASLTWGGAELLLSQFAAEARDAEIDLTVSYLQDKHGSPAAARLRGCGVDPMLVPITGLLNVADHLRVRRHLAALAPDVVHTHLGVADLLAGGAARTLGIPSVSTLHVIDAEPGLRGWAKDRLMSLARRRWARRVIAVSDSLRREYLAAGYDRPEHVVTVHNGIGAKARPGAGARVRRELGLGEDELVAAMVTVLRPGKGHEEAVEAVEQLRGRFPTLRLLVLGDGPSRADIEASVGRLGRAGLMAGHREDVMEVLDAVDVLLHPSSADAFPTTLLEAMAAGVPIVATRVGGIPEIVHDGEEGVLIDVPVRPSALAEAVGGLLADRGLRFTLGRAGRKTFEQRFSIDRWVDAMRDIYEDALADTTSGRRRALPLESTRSERRVQGAP